MMSLPQGEKREWKRKGGKFGGWDRIERNPSNVKVAKMDVIGKIVSLTYSALLFPSSNVSFPPVLSSTN
eukprot:1325759-Amorphochlora_amoeboformis.AAC.1